MLRPFNAIAKLKRKQNRGRVLFSSDALNLIAILSPTQAPGGSRNNEHRWFSALRNVTMKRN